MGQFLFDRICYSNGIVKPENKRIELHAVCDCDRCNGRKNSLYHGLRNGLTVTIKDEGKIIEAEEFIRNWKCNKNEYSLTPEYVSF
jgi:hypothetical protein